MPMRDFLLKGRGRYVGKNDLSANVENPFSKAIKEVPESLTETSEDEPVGEQEEEVVDIGETELSRVPLLYKHLLGRKAIALIELHDPFKELEFVRAIEDYSYFEAILDGNRVWLEAYPKDPYFDFGFMYKKIAICAVYEEARLISEKVPIPEGVLISEKVPID